MSLEGMREVPQVLNIPSTINGLPVLKIGIGFNENEILSLTIPNTVQEIALSAFQ